MNRWKVNLSRRYAAALSSYLARRQERHLNRAYEAGREAMAGGLGVLDMARIHNETLRGNIRALSSPAAKRRAVEVGFTLFQEALSPFEASHRGFREANLKLHQLNDSLESRNAQLARANRELEQSKEHYRQLLCEARQMQENLRSLSSQILHAQEDERRRISRDLHDDVGQALTAISVNLGLLQRNGAAGAGLAARKIADMQTLLRQTMETVHGFARELRPEMLDELGLLPALRSHLKSFASRTGLRAHFRGSIGAEKLNGEQKTVMFRVAQESLANVARHAHASRVMVSVRALKGAIRMQIQDNGRSFKVRSQSSVNGKKRLGLLGMQERLLLVGGRFAVKSLPGHGTKVCAEIPMKPGELKSKGHGND